MTRQVIHSVSQRFSSVRVQVSLRPTNSIEFPVYSRTPYWNLYKGEGCNCNTPVHDDPLLLFFVCFVTTFLGK